jgi:hypothetical protein
VPNDTAEAYNFTNTTSDRAALPDVFDISGTSAFGTEVVGLFVGDTFDWQGSELTVAEVMTASQWTANGGAVRHKPPKEFTNTEYGLPGNPTHRRR